MKTAIKAITHIAKWGLFYLVALPIIIMASLNRCHEINELSKKSFTIEVRYQCEVLLIDTLNYQNTSDALYYYNELQDVTVKVIRIK